MRISWRSVLAVTLGLCVSAAACSRDAEGVVEPSEFLFPGESKISSRDAEAQIGTLIADFADSEIALAACLRDEGFMYQPRVVEYHFNLVGEGLPTIAEVLVSHGYGIVDGEGSGGLTVEIFGGEVPLDQRDAFSAYLEGDAPCSRFEYRKDIQIQISDLRGGTSELSERVQASAEFVTATQDWSSCMHSAGYEFGAPADAFDFIETRLEAIDQSDSDYAAIVAELQNEEITVATQDLECFQTWVAPVLQRAVKD